MSSKRGLRLEGKLLSPGLSGGLEMSRGAMGASKAQAGERGKEVRKPKRRSEQQRRPGPGQPALGDGKRYHSDGTSTDLSHSHRDPLQQPKSNSKETSLFTCLP